MQAAPWNRRGLRDDPSGAGLVYRQDSRLHDFDGFDFEQRWTSILGRL